MNKSQQNCTSLGRFVAAVDAYCDGTASVTMRWFDRRWRREFLLRFAMTFQRLGYVSGQAGPGHRLRLGNVDRRGGELRSIIPERVRRLPLKVFGHHTTNDQSLA